jgi:hypothetical protein
MLLHFTHVHEPQLCPANDSEGMKKMALLPGSLGRRGRWLEKSAPISQSRRTPIGIEFLFRICARR